MNSFVDIKRTRLCTILLDETFEAFEEPRFANIASLNPMKSDMPLYPHQKILLKALMDFEEKRILAIHANEDIYYIHSDAVRLSSKLGSGKTLVYIALIAHRGVPSILPFFEKIKHSDMPRNIIGMTPRQDNLLHHAPESVVAATLIVCASHVVDQVESTIKIATHLRYFIVANKNSLMAFRELFVQNRLNEYQVYVVRDGNVSIGKDYQILDCNPTDKNIVDIIGRMTKNLVWGRLIYDDYDTLALPPTTEFIKSLFTIYVSATNKITNNRREANYVVLASRDSLLVNVCNITCVDEFIDRSLELPLAHVVLHKFTHEKDGLIGIIGMINADTTQEIAELINGDAIDAAAKLANASARSINGILKALVKGKYSNLERTTQILHRLRQFGSANEDTPLPSGHKITTKDIEKIIKTFRSGKYPDGEYFLCPRLRNALAKFYDEMTDRRDSILAVFTRVQNNILYNICLVCKDFIQYDAGAFITTCCGYILCIGCCRSAKFNSHRPNLKTSSIEGKCPNPGCFKKIDFATGILHIDRSFDITKLVQVDWDSDDQEIVPNANSTCDESEKMQYMAQNKKLQSMLSIIRNIPPEEECQVKKITLPKLITGNQNKPAPSECRRVVVAANHDESIKIIIKFLEYHSIDIHILHGVHNNITSAIESFRSNGGVLLLTGKKYCSGLNLQFATDLIFYHKIFDPSDNIQLMGRIIRMGRMYNAKIHYLLYANEAQTIKDIFGDDV